MVSRLCCARHLRMHYRSDYLLVSQYCVLIVSSSMSIAAIAAINDDQPNEYPARADLRSQIYRPLPAVSLPVDQPNPESMSICTEVLESLFKGLSAGDAAAVKESFYPDQSYWRDQLALTYHFRTFTDRDVITQALVDRTSTNKLDKLTVLPGTARLTPAGPTLVSIFQHTTRKMLPDVLTLSHLYHLVSLQLPFDDRCGLTASSHSKLPTQQHPAVVWYSFCRQRQTTRRENGKSGHWQLGFKSSKVSKRMKLD